MNFPYSYKNKIELTFENFSGSNYSLEKISKILSDEKAKQNIYDFEFNRGRIFFSSKNSLFRFEYKITVYSEKNKDKTYINYRIDLEKLIMITLVGMISLAFLSFISVSKFLIIAGIFAVVFYSVNLFFINNYILRIINTAIGNESEFKGSESFSEEQKEWMNNPDKCPACGCYVSKYDKYCLDCGLKVNRKSLAKPLDITKYKNKTVEYHYKEKKK